MRAMNQSEIKKLIKNHTWTTLCTVDAGGNPYAIEFNYFLMDGYICGLIKPSGTTAKNIKHNPNVCLKMCETDDSCREYQAVSVFGKGEFVQNEEWVIKGWDLLEERLKLPKGAYAKYKEKFLKKKSKYPIFKVKPEKMTGITSITKEEK